MVNHAENLEVLRKQIDKFDEDLVELLCSRFDVVRKVGEFKKKNNMLLCDKSRQAEVLKLRIKQGSEKGLDADFVEKLYGLIFDEAIRIQECEK